MVVEPLQCLTVSDRLLVLSRSAKALGVVPKAAGSGEEGLELMTTSPSTTVRAWGRGAGERDGSGEEGLEFGTGEGGLELMTTSPSTTVRTWGRGA